MKEEGVDSRKLFQIGEIITDSHADEVVPHPGEVVGAFDGPRWAPDRMYRLRDAEGFEWTALWNEVRPASEVETGTHRKLRAEFIASRPYASSE